MKSQSRWAGQFKVPLKQLKKRNKTFFYKKPRWSTPNGLGGVSNEGKVNLVRIDGSLNSDYYIGVLQFFSVLVADALFGAEWTF